MSRLGGGAGTGTAKSARPLAATATAQEGKARCRAEAGEGESGGDRREHDAGQRQRGGSGPHGRWNEHANELCEAGFARGRVESGAGACWSDDGGGADIEEQPDPLSDCRPVGPEPDEVGMRAAFDELGVADGAGKRLSVGERDAPSVRVAITRVGWSIRALTSGVGRRSLRNPLSGYSLEWLWQDFRSGRSLMSCGVASA